MITVTGYMKLNNGLYAKDPSIKTTIRFDGASENITAELAVHIAAQNGITQQVYNQSNVIVPKSELVYPEELTNPENDMLTAIEEWLCVNYFDTGVFGVVS